jgi:hypothetical protein
MTLREHISLIRGSHRLLSTDASINDRLIASKIRASTMLLLKKETDYRKLWSTDTIFTTIPCLELVEVPITECCDYKSDCTIARTKTKLPRILEGNYQYLIKGVYSIDALSGKGKKLKEVSLNRYLNLLKLPVVKGEPYYLIHNGYLYVTSPGVKFVKLVAAFEDHSVTIPEDCDCSRVIENKKEDCVSPLDLEYNMPGYMQKMVYDIVSKELLESYFSLPQDMSDDDVDEQAPGARRVPADDKG